MKNVMVANFRKDKTNSVKQYKQGQLIDELKIQIENSLELGWNPKDIWVVTNFPFSHMNIGSIQLPLNTDCLTGSKMFAMRSLFRHGMVNDNIWIHDLDAWQTARFDFPDIKDVGLAEYSLPKFNGGSMFYRPTAEDIVEDICKYLEDNKEAREEPTLDKLLRGKYKDRTTVVNSTFNVGCSAMAVRFDRAEKPIKVAHFHPCNRLGWDSHVRGRYGPEYVTVPDRLASLFMDHFRHKIETYKYEDDRKPYERRDRAVDREKAKKMKV